MKQILLLVSISCLLLASTSTNAQCGVGFTSAQLNWDMLDYYYNSGSNVQPYGFSGGNYITNAMEQTQRFGVGRNMVTFVTSAAGLVDGENATHTGNIAGYDGEDAQFTPSGAGQTITLTFKDVVSNLRFTLYDVDLSQRIDFGAVNAASVAQTVNVTTYASTILTVNNNNTTTARITASATALGNSENRGSATITIAGPVKTVTLTINTVGTDAVFWMSDLNVCNPTDFPVNYQQSVDNQPLQGPAGNQPSYFLVTPDNNWVYMINAANGQASRVFQDPAKQYVNSLAYDMHRRILYYIAENSAVNSGNRELKKHDFNTGVTSVLVADITATLGIPTMGSGVESAGAAFYDDAIYLGIEGGRHQASGVTRTRETLIWRIDLDGSGVPSPAYQVFGTNAYDNGTGNSIHDFGDFVIRDGVLFDFNTARITTSNYTPSKYHHFDMNTGAHQSWNNPGSSIWNGQSAMDWAGTLYYFRNGSGSTGQMGVYLENGTNGAATNITVIDGSGAWPGGNGDAAENFRPEVDFGDAPASYDPNPASPAAHSESANLFLGTSYNKEWVTRGQSALANADTYDDAIAYVPTFSPTYDQYLVQVTVRNNTGANAIVGGWLDYNGNGVFEAGEGRTVTVGSSASAQQVWLYWASAPSSLPFGTYTYLRLRVTSASNAMTTAHATGYFSNGEVEDYRVPVNNFPLAVQYQDFNVSLTASKTVSMNWKVADETGIGAYIVERSQDQNKWTAVAFQNPDQNNNGVITHESMDEKPLQGTSYYRLKTVQTDGKAKLSDIKRIDMRAADFLVSIAPNPATVKTALYINTKWSEKAMIEMINGAGVVVHREQATLRPGTNAVTLPVGKLASGRYLIRVSAGANHATQNLIINK